MEKINEKGIFKYRNTVKNLTIKIKEDDNNIVYKNIFSI